MGILIAAVLVVAGFVGAGVKEGAFKKGYDTTHKDTVAFEKSTLEQKLARIQSKERTVYEVKGESTELKVARLNVKEEKIKEEIARLEGIERTMGWTE